MTTKKNQRAARLLSRRNQSAFPTRPTAEMMQISQAVTTTVPGVKLPLFDEIRTVLVVNTRCAQNKKVLRALLKAPASALTTLRTFRSRTTRTMIDTKVSQETTLTASCACSTSAVTKLALMTARSVGLFRLCSPGVRGTTISITSTARTDV